MAAAEADNASNETISAAITEILCMAVNLPGFSTRWSRRTLAGACNALLMRSVSLLRSGDDVGLVAWTSCLRRQA